MIVGRWVDDRSWTKHRTVLVAIAVVTMTGTVADAQGRGTATPGPPQTAKQIAPQDLTGYWVSVVGKEWRFRMVVPQKGDFFGDFGGIPINAEARRVANTWDPAADEAAHEECRGFGAAGVMRVPGRLHITWQDDNTLRVDTDAGTQTRLLRFTGAPAAAGEATWQGTSAARWVLPRGARGRQGGASQQPNASRDGSLEVMTTNMRSGYLRRNGVPYSDRAAMTEFWDSFDEPDGTTWLVITTTIVDPTYLQMPYETSPVFKREPNGAKWDPSPCSARW